MLKKREGGNRKILLYYVVAIVLPCIVLGGLAFRGILNDQALVEKENRRELMDLAEGVSLSLLTSLNLVEKELFPQFQVASIPGSVIFRDSSLENLLPDHTVIQHIYLLSLNNQMHCLDHDLLYLPDELMLLDTYSPSYSLSEAMTRGWQLEFREKNYRKAIDHYNATLRRLENDNEKSIVHNIIARIYKKSGNLNRALSVYDHLYDNFSGIYLQQNIPVGITVLREKLKIHIQNKEEALCTRVLMLLLDHLMKAEWSIAKSYYQNTLKDINEVMKSLEKIPDSINERINRLSLLEQNTEYRLSFLSASEEIRSVGGQEKVFAKYSIRFNGNNYYFSILPKEGNQWVVLYDLNHLVDSVMVKSIQEEEKLKNTSWIVKGWQGENIRESGKQNTIELPVKYSFPLGLPPWSLELYPEHKGAMATFLSTGGGNYFYILILILVILAFGLMLTMHTINQELRLSRMKSYFISTVSHEFKSPLTSIRQMAEMLDRDRVQNESRKKAYYSTMLHQSERLSHLIENILDFARMEEGRKQYHFQKGNITEKVGEIVNTFRTQLGDQDFEISYNISGSIPEIYFDEEAMEQVVHNLLDNAIKYSGDSKKIEVEMVTKKENVCLSIKDYGIGIPKSQHNKVFDRFYRVGDELTSRIKGSGIGLTIVRQIVEAHRGKVLLDSRPGSGTTFNVLLPIN